ncbi:MAG TPA: hypothetical protein VN812_15725 [Candidatus Acidoferrales bacterium]|nr:hypothetical protein [Candidatus Acidoferrales bacterium]
MAPWNRYTFQRTREFMPTATVRRDTGPVSPLRPDPQDVAAITFECDSSRVTSQEFLHTFDTDGFIVAHPGKVLAEHYANGMTATTSHLSQSVA